MTYHRCGIKYKENYRMAFFEKEEPAACHSSKQQVSLRAENQRLSLFVIIQFLKQMHCRSRDN